MCGKPKTPKPVKSDPVADEQAAKDRATTKTNAQIAFRTLGGGQTSLLANWGGAAGVNGDRGSAVSRGPNYASPYIGPVYVPPASSTPSKNMGGSSGKKTTNVGGRPVLTR